jgi:hypothetical protein
MRRDRGGEVKTTKDQRQYLAENIHKDLDDIDELEAENDRLRAEMREFIEAYAPDFFNEPFGFKPKLDMNSAALVRRTLLLILKEQS